MAIKRYRQGQIIAKLREADFLLSQGHTVPTLSRLLKFPKLHITAGERNTAA
jgi:hypothetical protein